MFSFLSKWLAVSILDLVSSKSLLMPPSFLLLMFFLDDATEGAFLDRVDIYSSSISGYSTLTTVLVATTLVDHLSSEAGS